MHHPTNCTTTRESIGLMPYLGISLVSMSIILFASVIFLLELVVSNRERKSKKQEFMKTFSKNRKRPRKHSI
jgi:NADH:ubiquinone oxidoreductase subunit 4 (subunit M)